MRIRLIQLGPGGKTMDQVRVGDKLLAKSHGVGLAIVKHLVESQHGGVGADFPASGGSVFWFELPAT